MCNQVRQTLAEWGFEVPARGEDMRCKCPIHGGTNPTSFHINLENGYWFCHSKCQEGGGLHKLAYLLGKDMPKIKQEKLWVDKEIFHPKQKLFEILPEGEPLQREIRGLSLDTLKNFKVREDATHIIFPVEVNLQTVAFEKRDKNPSSNIRWINQPNGIQFGNLIYNYDHLENELTFVTEGIFDALSLYEIGITNVCSTFTCNITQEQKNMLMKKSFQICLAFDNDDAGKKATQKMIKLLQHDFQVFTLEYDGKDINEWLVSDGGVMRVCATNPSRHQAGRTAPTA